MSLISTLPMIIDRKISTFLPILQLFSITERIILLSDPVEVDRMTKDPLNSDDYELKLYWLGIRISFCLAPRIRESKLIPSYTFLLEIFLMKVSCSTIKPKIFNGLRVEALLRLSKVLLDWFSTRDWMSHGLTSSISDEFKCLMI